MIFAKFLALPADAELTSAEAQALNADLATKSSGDIPTSQRDQVVDYLIQALNLNSVDVAIVQVLDDLLAELQRKPT